jgi:hypothetical protein
VREALDAGQTSLQDAVIVCRPRRANALCTAPDTGSGGLQGTRSECNASAATKISPPVTNTRNVPGMGVPGLISNIAIAAIVPNGLTEAKSTGVMPQGIGS